jgi:predicted O-methyltransferase YrrM
VIHTEGLDVIQRLLTDKPAFHMGGEARWDAMPETLEEIRRCANNRHSTLEVGVGLSTVVFAASGADHTAISPDPAEHQLVREYCRKIGIDDSHVRFVTGLSDDVLPSLLSRDRTLDVAFIDGSHSFPAPTVDWYFASRSLKPGGKLILDDIAIPAAGLAFRHMKLDKNWHLDEVLDDRAAAFTLLITPGVEDDWINQPFNTNYPDFSFAKPPKRAYLEMSWHIKRARSGLARRYPGLRRIHKRVA